MNKQIHCILGIVIALFFVILGGIHPAQASSEGDEKMTTVKVAFYPLEGFFEYDENGNECGYGVDLLNELSKYENIKWEYVPVDSWEDIEGMMENGDVDVKMPATVSKSSSYKYDFTLEPVLTSYRAIMTLKDRGDLNYKDYESLSKLRIAITPNMNDKSGVDYYLKSIGVWDKLKSYPDYNSCRAALDDGKVDALISNVMDLTSDMKILEKFSVTDNYITTLKGNKCYAAVNDALTQLKLQNPNFQTILSKKYFPERIVEPFTKEEEDYIAEKKYITVAVCDDRKPVSFYNRDTGNYEGIAIEMANLISEKIGIKFKYITVDTDTPVEMLERADLVMPVQKNADSSKYFVTSDILNTEIYMAVKNGNAEPGEGARIAVLSTTPGIKRVMENLDTFEIVEYDNMKEALKAVQKGDVDAVANSSYVINWSLESPYYENLSALRYKSYPIAYEICGSNDDLLLQTILNKGISAITDDEKNDIITQNTHFTKNDYSIGERIYENRHFAVMSFVIIIMIIFVAVFHNHSRTIYIREIEKSVEEQKKANLAKRDFLSRMSHDMRTPMNGILGMTELSKGVNDPKILTENIGKINESGKYLLSLINDTLDFQRIESGQLELKPEVIDCNTLLESVFAMIKPAIDAKNIDFRVVNKNVDMTGNILIDPVRLRQIMVNLLSNAIKFTPNNGVITFEYGALKKSGIMSHDKIVISDTGVGMSKDFIENKIFTPFSQEKNEVTGQYAGSGLGLSIVKSLIEMMGGTILVESEPGCGTTFTILMDFEHVNEEMVTDAKNDKVKAQAEIEKELSGKNILLAEDHPLNAEIASKMLEKMKCNVEWAQDGKIAVEKFASSELNFYDIILMDIRMPVMDGLAAAKKIRSLGRLDALTIPIIAMTANAYTEDVQASIDAGMNAHLAKPVDPMIMYETIEKNLR